MTGPESNQPGVTPSPGRIRRPFAFARWATPVLRVLGVRPGTAWVEVDAAELRVRYGRWRVVTPRSNIVGVEVTGPYRPWKVIGPHLSLADDGLTLGTTTARGVCVRFAEPIEPVLPLVTRRHTAVTVTVADPDAVAELLGG